MVNKGIWKTSFGEYSAGVSKASMSTYEGEGVGTRKFYIETKVNEDIVFEMCVEDEGKLQKALKTVYRVPDFHRNETIDVNLSDETSGKVEMKIKCKQSIWDHVIPENIPPKIDLMQGQSFPVEVTCHAIQGNILDFSPANRGAPYIKLVYNEQKKKTGPLLCYGDNNSLRDNGPWNQTFLMFVTSGTSCHVKFKTLHQSRLNTFGKKETVAIADFIWPDCLLGNDEKNKIPIEVPLSDNKGILQLTISRFREMSVFFRKYYLHENF